MNDIANSKLDLIWTLAADEYVKDLICESRVSRADAVMDAWTENKILRMIRKEHNRTKRRKLWKVVRIALVACLTVATLAFAACMAFPTVREAIWKVVLQWGDESVKIEFVPSDDPDYTSPAGTTTDVSAGITTTELSDPSTQPDPPDQPVVEPPTSIEEVNVPAYVPAGYTVESTGTRKTHTLMYYNAAGEIMITFKQMTVSFGSEGDAQDGIATDVTINGMNAILITYEDQPNAFLLYWQDAQYKYNIHGYFESYDELIELANSVAVK